MGMPVVASKQCVWAFKLRVSCLILSLFAMLLEEGGACDSVVDAFHFLGGLWQNSSLEEVFFVLEEEDSRVGTIIVG